MEFFRWRWGRLCIEEKRCLPAMVRGGCRISVDGADLRAGGGSAEQDVDGPRHLGPVALRSILGKIAFVNSTPSQGGGKPLRAKGNPIPFGLVALLRLRDLGNPLARWVGENRESRTLSTVQVQPVRHRAVPARGPCALAARCKSPPLAHRILHLILPVERGACLFL